MNYSDIAGQCLLLIVAVGSAAAFNPGGRGSLSLSSPSPSEDCWACSRRPSTWSRTTLLFARPKTSGEEMEGRKSQLRKLLCATEAEIEKFVSRVPNVLARRDIVDAYSSRLVLLQERFGISKKEAVQVYLKADRLIMYAPETLTRKIDWLQTRLNLTKTQLWNIIKGLPVILTYSIDDNLQPKLDNIQSVLEMSDDEVTKMVWKAPSVLQEQVSSEKLAARLSFLQSLLSIEEGDIESLRKAIVKRPEILFYPEERMVENQHWISERLGLSDARIAQMCRNMPDLLTSKVTTLAEKVDWVQTALSLNDEELGKLFGQFPRLFGCCPKKNLEPKLRFLRLTFDLDDQGLKDLVMKQPGLFSASEKAIEEKIKFYSELVGESEAKRIVMESTNFLLPSLTTRLRPRLSEIQKAGTKVVWTEQLIQRLARRTDDQWERYGLGEAPRGRRRSSESDGL